MRTLSTVELDEVFAGDGGVSATLPTVTVTAPHFTNPSTPFPYSGSSWAGPTYNENGGYCYSGAGTFFAVEWRAIPDMADVRCELDKAAPGMGIPATASLTFVNSWAFKDRATGNVVHKPDNVPPPNSDYLFGQADAAHNAVYIYALGFSSNTTTGKYIDPDTLGEPKEIRTNMTPFQNALLTAAHEAAHGHGVTDELLAQGYAVKALLRYRENPNQCP